ILGDLVQNPRFEADDINRERQVIKEEIKMVEDVPDDLVQEIFTQTYWRGHALGRPILGTSRTVGQLTRRELVSYFHRHYAPSNLIVAAAGNLRHEQLSELSRTVFGRVPAGRPAPTTRPPIANPHLKIRRKKDLEQAHICIGAPAFHQTHERRFAAYVMNSVLGGGMSSRLFQNIREKRGLAYAIISGLSAFHDAGCLNVYAGTATEKVREVVRLIVAELARMKEMLLTPTELQHAKDYLKGSLLLSLESTMSRMSHLARQEAYFGRHVSIEEIAAGVDAVTPEQVRGVARELLSAERLALTILAPRDNLKISRADLAC
ncbi:MAG: insulinase family protein, partial [Acidobacteria bacterium]|nr:insulinase family protein [Acidobacteriota bacterium]